MKEKLKELEISGGDYRLGYYLYEDHTAILYNRYVDRHGSFEVVIPEKVVDEGTEYTVVGIREGIFYSRCADSDIVSCTLPNTITSIPKEAFSGCTALRSITLPETIKYIGAEAFEDCFSLTSLVVPNGVLALGHSAFARCTSLSSIELPESLLFIDEDAFIGCSALKSIRLPQNITSIGEAAFKECTSLVSIDIPDSVRYIGDRAFRDCENLKSVKLSHSLTELPKQLFNWCTQLTSITIPKSITNIGEGGGDVHLFSDCSNLTTIVVEEGNPKYDSRENCNAIIETKTNTLWVGTSKTIIPNTVTKIASHAFDGRIGLTSISIPGSVAQISWSAFSGCSNLTELTIPDGVTSIYSWAFADTGLKSIFIPKSVERLGDAFNSCNLTSIVVDPENSYYDSRNNCNAIIDKKHNALILGSATTVIPQGVTSIAEKAFCNCSDLKSIVIPDSVTTIKDSAFEGCTGLLSVIIPNSVTEIGAGAFKGCTGLTSVGISKSKALTTISRGTFRNCTSLESVIIPNNVTKIEHDAFEHCTSLRNITLPANVQVASSAFDVCTNQNASEEKNELQTTFFIKITGHIEEIRVLPIGQILGSDWKQKDKTTKDLAKSLYTQGIFNQMNESDFIDINKKIIDIESVSIAKVQWNLSWNDYLAHQAEYPIQTYTKDAFIGNKPSKFEKGDYCRSGLIGVREYLGDVWLEIVSDKDTEFTPLLFNFNGSYNDNNLQYNGKYNVRLLSENMQTLEAEETFLRDGHNSSAVRVR